HSASGEQSIEIFSGERKLESGTIDVKQGYDAVVWNVLGVGAVTGEKVQHRSTGIVRTVTKATSLCGKRAIVLDDVDYVFGATLAKHASTKKTTTTRISFDESAPSRCFDELSSGSLAERALAGQGALYFAEASHYERDAVSTAYRLLQSSDQQDAALKL